MTTKEQMKMISIIENHIDDVERLTKSYWEEIIPSFFENLPSPKTIDEANERIDAAFKNTLGRDSIRFDLSYLPKKSLNRFFDLEDSVVKIEEILDLLHEATKNLEEARDLRYEL